MKKDEAKEILRIKLSALRRAEIMLEINENDVREMKEDIKELEAIINKKDDWRERLVDPKKDKHFYISADFTSRYGVNWLTPTEYKRNAALLFKEESHAKVMANKIQLMQEMHAFAHVKNEGWEADWESTYKEKYGIVHEKYGVFKARCRITCNSFVFGVSVKSQEIAREMFEEFGERIEEIYNKQY